MIWSFKELENLAVMGEKTVIERVMAHLGEPENQDIFEKDNFSYLWGALGIVGIKGIEHNVLDRVWRVLKENDVLEAFDKGVLGDFNQNMIKKYPDNRLRAWNNFDNFTADQKFKKLILMPLVSINRKYAQEVDMQAFNPYRVLGVLERYPMSDAVKLMLTNMKGQGAVCGIWGKEVVEHYEKEKILGKLCDIIAYAKRTLNEDEKDFLFRYIYEAIADGFLPENIRLRDEVFAGLMADKADMENMSELELSNLRERNAEIVEFAKSFDIQLGFLEKSAVKLIRYDLAHIQEMVDRCLWLMDKTEPKGVVFALELVNLKQVKSAVKILIELAKRGRATETTLFLHRLLPYVKGAETMIMSILKLNLKVLKEKREKKGDNVFFKEYPARVYMTAVKTLEEYGAYKEAGVLLTELVEEGWVCGIKDLEEECVDEANLLLSRHKDLAKTLSSVANAMNLKMYYGDNEVYILYNKEMGLKGIRKNAERFLGEVKGVGKSGIYKGIEVLSKGVKGIVLGENDSEAEDVKKVELDGKASVEVSENIENLEDVSLNIGVETNNIDAVEKNEKENLSANVENQDIGENIGEENSKLGDVNEEVVYSSEEMRQEVSEFKEDEFIFGEDEVKEPQQELGDVNEEVVYNAEEMKQEVSEFQEDEFIFSEDEVKEPQQEQGDVNEEVVYNTEEMRPEVSEVKEDEFIFSEDEVKEPQQELGDVDSFLGIGDDNLKENNGELVLEEKVEFDINENKEVSFEGNDNNFISVFGKQSEENRGDLSDNGLIKENRENLGGDINENQFSGNEVLPKNMESVENNKDMESVENNVDTQNTENAEGDIKVNLIKSKIEQWNSEDNDEVTSDRGVSKFLKIKMKDMDKHFDKIKEITSSAIKRVDNVDKHFDKIKEITNDVVKRAEVKAMEIKQRVEEKDIDREKIFGGFKKFGEKIKSFKKKQ